LPIQPARRIVHGILADCNPVYLWRKSIAATGASGWIAQVDSCVGAGRPVIIAPAASRSPRMEVYCEGADEARELARRFGGQVRQLLDARWQPAPATARGRPLAMGGTLLVTAWPDELAALRSVHRAKQVLCIPAAMAFGTGEHATTAMCLRLLAEASRRRRESGWELLDLGTGSGILSLAGSLLGAKRALGLDNDANAVRTAKENARLNGMRPGAVTFRRADLLKWTAPQEQQWPVITANLFSELLIRLLPKVIAPALAPGGDLILSGVLADQAEEVAAAIRGAGLELVQVKRRGRWRAFWCSGCSGGGLPPRGRSRTGRR
jgi:ribosomal protein L11 methyltransferase